jgi:hypothetical protein
MVERKGHCGLLMAVGIVWEVVPLSFFGAQAQPNGLCAAIGYISTHKMSVVHLGSS